MEWETCRQKIIIPEQMSAAYWLQISTGHSSSTTSYFTSTGPCAAIGNRSTAIENFYTHSKEQLKKQAAEQRGNHLVMLGTLLDCTPRGQKILEKHLGKTEHLFSQWNYGRFKDFLKRDSELNQNCHI